MATRVVVGLTLVVILFSVLYGLPAFGTAALLSLLAALGVYEALWSTGCVRKPRICAYSMVLAAGIPVWFYTGANRSVALGGLFVYVFLIFLEAMASKYTLTLEKMGSAFFVSLMIPVFLSALLRIRQGEWGIYYIILPFVVAYMSDTFALFAGMFFGKHKLAPTLSPKKTREGAVGGIVGGIVGCLLFGVIVSRFFQLTPNYAALALYGLLGSPVAQLGDLAFSYIKRQYGIKDFGKIFPGHGGVLDRVDSLIFCAPFVEILITCFPAL